MAFHSGFHWGDELMKQINRFISMHALSFCYFNMIHMTNWIVNGIPERFPKLKVIWVESGLAWVPFMMQRIDTEYMMRTSEAPLLKRRPSEYMREMYFTSQPLETSNLETDRGDHEGDERRDAVALRVGLAALGFRSAQFDHRPALPVEEAKRNILGLNAARLFNFEVPTNKLAQAPTPEPALAAVYRVRRRKSAPNFAAVVADGRAARRPRGGAGRGAAPRVYCGGPGRMRRRRDGAGRDSRRLRPRR